MMTARLNRHPGHRRSTGDPRRQAPTSPFPGVRMHLSLRRAITLAATLWAGQASAALVTMTGLSQGFQGVGSPIGTAVSATFDLDFAGGAHVFLDRASVRSFSVQFGAIVFNSSDLTNWDFEMYTDATGAVGGLQLLARFGGPSPHPLCPPLYP